MNEPPAQRARRAGPARGARGRRAARRPPVLASRLCTYKWPSGAGGQTGPATEQRRGCRARARGAASLQRPKLPLRLSFVAPACCGRRPTEGRVVRRHSVFRRGACCGGSPLYHPTPAGHSVPLLLRHALDLPARAGPSARACCTISGPCWRPSHRTGALRLPWGYSRGRVSVQARPARARGAAGPFAYTALEYLG